MTGSERFLDDFEKMIFQHFFEFLDFSENLQKSIKSDVSDTNGHQKRACRVENMLIDPGETNFRCTVTHFIEKNHILEKKIRNYETLSAELPFLTQRLHRNSPGGGGGRR